MRFQVFAQTLLIGESDLPNLDPSMGIASGTFVPAAGYKSVQAVFRLYPKAVWSAEGQDRERLEHYWREREDLNLMVRLRSGETMPVQYVHIEDYSAELDEMILTVALHDSYAFDHYFEVNA